MSVLVLCVGCSALRRADVEKCFCGEVAVRPAPPPRRAIVPTQTAVPTSEQRNDE